MNKLNRSPYSKLTNEVAAHVVVAGSSTVVVSGCFGGAPISDGEYQGGVLAADRPWC